MSSWGCAALWETLNPKPYAAAAVSLRHEHDWALKGRMAGCQAHVNYLSVAGQGQLSISCQSIIFLF